ncbi:hypothetical protein AX17_006692 [Amanita inopinata Kibby_2008]|nr:hypothetical protein AX17_006692 [Amanita inopinata Kibby_2008]
MDVPVDPAAESTQVALSIQMRIRTYAQMVSVLFLALEAAHMFGDEIKYIWRVPWTITKPIYLFSRYAILAYQIASFIIVFKYMSQLPINLLLCHRWFHSQTIFSLVMLHLLELVLILRVYALYGRDPKIGGLLLLTYLGEICASVVCIRDAYVREIYKLDDACFSPPASPTTSIISGIVVVQQSLLWFLTYAKLRGASQHGWADNPIIKVVVRDGAFVFVTILILVVSIALYLSVTPTHVTHITRPFFIPFFSVVICKLIMNTQRLRYDTQEKGMELTTIPNASIGVNMSV